MNNYIIHREEDQLEHHGILGMHWGIRRFQNKDGSLTPTGKQRYSTDEKTSGRTITNRIKSKLGIYKEGDGNSYVSEKRRKNRQVEETAGKVQKTLDQYENKKEAGYTLKNKVKSALGIYKEGDNNPYVSEKRREDRRRQEEEQKKQQAEESTKRANKDIEKGQWYKTYNDATDKFNPLLEKLNERLGDKADINDPDYIEAVGNLWNGIYSETIVKKYGSGVSEETIKNFPLYDMYFAEIRTR